MKKSSKIAFLSSAGVIVIALLVVGLFNIIEASKEREAEKIETEEVISMRLDRNLKFLSLEDSLEWALLVDLEIMLRYSEGSNPQKYHLKADSIAALFKLENLETSLIVLEKSRGVEKAADFVYSRYRFDYEKNYQVLDSMNAQDAIELISSNIFNWSNKFYKLQREFELKECFKILDDELDRLVRKNNDILWVASDYQARLDLLSSLYSSVNDESVVILAAYSCYKYVAAKPSEIIDLIDTETISKDYRLGKLLSPKRYDEVIAYLEETAPKKAVDYLAYSGMDEQRFRRLLLNNPCLVSLNGLRAYERMGVIKKEDVRSCLLNMPCESLTSMLLASELRSFCKDMEIKDYELIILSSIKDRHDIHLAEIFFNNHSDLYGDRNFLYKALGEKWDSFK